MIEPYLAFHGVTKRFGDLDVVAQPFSITVERNEFVVFLGPSGCGKTTLMRMIGGLETPSSGAICLEGLPVGGPDHRRGMVFQSYSSFPWLTVAENVAFGMRYRKDLTEQQKLARARQLPGTGWAVRVLRRLSQQGVGRHAPAGGHRPHLGGRLRRDADGRAVRSAGRPAAGTLAGGASGDPAARRQDHRLRDPRCRGSGVPGGPGHRLLQAPGPRHGRYRHHRTAWARSVRSNCATARSSSSFGMGCCSLLREAAGDEE